MVAFVRSMRTMMNPDIHAGAVEQRAHAVHGIAPLMSAS